MGKKLVRFASAGELILVFVYYLVIDYSYSNDETVMNILAMTGIVSTLMRLAIYVIPGMHLVTGLFGEVFYSRGLLCFVGLLSLLISLATFSFRGTSVFLSVLAYVSIANSLIYLAGSLLDKS